ncbi:hypothetical protein [Pseudomonas lijiangensis]|uniref:Uncharacterized protein n=1 Tax=Pseudomonas lijiangensis TaxID=2995658 RepID=A0ABX8HY52_9PSED|nr:hypothetical protein [Pseudomonas lijiangensis]MBX8498705.1 hypothetical protein [Pseudomonas lijiangensis]MBX8507755.1 hypothetical protein [Pseudomonas lijiangensis]QWU85432.1 hypothetical protein KQP88_11970 [Pseudomonas lijiangensis]
MNELRWYLPLSGNLSAALSNAALPDIVRLSRYEIAAILYVLQLPKLPIRSPLEMERIFANLLTHHSDKLRSALAEAYSQVDFEAGLIQASALAIGLMDRESVVRGQYIHYDGTWNFDYAKQHKASLGAIKHEHVRSSGLIVKLSDHQLRLVHNIRANLDDSIEAQAYAGTGKSFILEEILALMPERKILFLADVDAKLDFVRRRFSSKRVWADTFKGIATQLLSGGDKKLKNRLIAISNLPFSYSLLAEKVGLSPVGSRDAAQVAALCWVVIFKFCSTNDTRITTKHIPRDQLRWLPASEQEVIAAAAGKVWFKMTSFENNEDPLPVKNYHLVKKMALSGLYIPEFIDTVIVDEGHDLTAPMVDILDRSPQTVITLGDQFQNLQGRYMPHNAMIRHREMAVSLRAGPALVDYINPLLAEFPDANALPFVADKAKDTVVMEYRADSFPSEPSVILVADEWGIFDWLIRNRALSQGAAVVDWGRKFEPFMEGCLGLFMHGLRPRHEAIARFKSWEQLRAVMGWNEAFLRVEQWLDTVGAKFGVSGLYQHASRVELAYGKPSRPLLATVFTVKNFEFPRMAISEDLYYFADLRSKTELSKKLALLYTAITRSSGKIYFPDTHQERIASILSSQSLRARPLSFFT